MSPNFIAGRPQAALIGGFRQIGGGK